MTDMLIKLYDLPCRSRPQPQVGTVRRALAPEKPAVCTWVNHQFGPGWAAECETAFGRVPVSCFIAQQDDQLAGFCVYDSTARGMLGPIGVAGPYQRRGLGREMLLSALEAMRAIGYAYAVVGWAESEAFFRRAAGAISIPGSEPGLYADLIRPRPD